MSRAAQEEELAWEEALARVTSKSGAISARQPEKPLVSKASPAPVTVANGANELPKAAPPNTIVARPTAARAAEQAEDERVWAEALRVAKARAEAEEEERAWQLALAETKARLREEEEREWAALARSRAEAVAPRAAVQRHAPRARGGARQPPYRAPRQQPQLVFWP